MITLWLLFWIGFLLGVVVHQVCHKIYKIIHKRKIDSIIKNDINYYKGVISDLNDRNWEKFVKQ